MTTKLNELDRALLHFAETYFAGVVGIEWDEACDYAQTVANRFRWQGDTHVCDSAVATHLYGEACRYANM